MKLAKLFILLFFCTPIVYAGATKVGNGDDGSDLEGSVPINNGPIIEARTKAVELLLKLNTPGISGLGALLPELKKSTVLLAKQDVKAKLTEDKNSFHSNMMENVYARTFAEPNAATRFFPAATKLDQDQLIALHIHEALHRSLPKTIREDEAIVSKITLAITTPDATHDQIHSLMENILPPETSALPAMQSQFQGQEVKEKEYYENPSNFGYSLRQFDGYTKQVTSYKLSRIHSIESFLYPFGQGRSAIGLGLEASLLEAQNGTQMGPLGISGRVRIWTFRDFDLHFWSTLYLNTLSAEELKNSPFGRDIFSLGLALSKENNIFYLENILGWSTGGSSSETIANTKITYQYGGVTQAGIHAGLKLWKLRLGGFAELDLADYFRVSGGLFNYDSGRYRVLSAGPELSYIMQSFSFGLSGRFLLNATKDANYDYLGDIMGQGVAQGSVTGTLKFFL